MEEKTSWLSPKKKEHVKPYLKYESPVRKLPKNMILSIKKCISFPFFILGKRLSFPLGAHPKG
jgi:hypothetical protein